MQASYTLEPIGRVTSSRSEAIDDGWDNETSEIVLDRSRVGSDATAGLEDFSHVEVIYLFDQVSTEKIVTGARHPRGNKAWPRIGILAQRGKNRPNRLGATICQLQRVDGNRLVLKGLDAIDGTPVLDVKPIMSGFLPRSEITEPQWAVEIMRHYWG